MWTVIMLAVALICAVIAVTRNDRVVELKGMLEQQQTESRRLAQAVSDAETQVTGVQDQYNAAIRDQTRLLVEIRELAAALDQGAHTVAARRLERLHTDFLTGGGA